MRLSFGQAIAILYFGQPTRPDAMPCCLKTRRSKLEQARPKRQQPCLISIIMVVVILDRFVIQESLVAQYLAEEKVVVAHALSGQDGIVE